MPFVDAALTFVRFASVVATVTVSGVDATECMYDGDDEEDAPVGIVSPSVIVVWSWVGA